MRHSQNLIIHPFKIVIIVTMKAFKKTREILSWNLKRRPPKTRTFKNNGIDDDELGQEDNLGAVENNAEDVGWDKAEDFKMDPTGTATTSKPYNSQWM
jgi:hypothetical protein